MKKLPLGIQDFVGIIEEDYLYIDKTRDIYHLITSGKVYFLSRPRRFGKSLLCSTLGAIFQGKKELFKGLFIESSDWEWQEYPVIRIDLNAANYSEDVKEFKILIKTSFKFIAEKYGVKLEGENPGDLFKNLIYQLNKKFKKKVVVIIDEYDKPLLSTIDHKALHGKFKELLKSFYGVLKSADEYLQFVFLTGVTKFSQVSVFSDLNQLTDISLNASFTSICGFTQAEVEHNFEEKINFYAGEKNISRDEYIGKLKSWYDGYRFSESKISVYNSYGLLNHFNTGKFEHYWFATGTPTFLLKLIEEQDIDILNLENMQASADAFADYRKDAMQAVPVLFQAGYLTIVDYDEQYGMYTLGYPNLEVRSAFAACLADKYAYAPEIERPALVVGFSKALHKGDVDTFMEIMQGFFAGIPYDLNDKTERHYQVVFYLIFRLLGQYLKTEVKVAAGRADAIAEAGEFVYCFEFKLFDTAEKALKQIDDKSYLTPYLGSGKKLVKVGVQLDAGKRNVGRYLVVK